MTEPKVSLTILVPGAVMMSSQECDKNPAANYNTERINVISDPNGKKSKKNTETLVIHTRKCIPAKQTILLPKEAYDYMTSEGGNEGTHIHQKIWLRMGKKARLDCHMKALAEAIGGEGAEYNATVLDD